MSIFLGLPHLTVVGDIIYKEESATISEDEMVPWRVAPTRAFHALNESAAGGGMWCYTLKHELVEESTELLTC